MEIVRDTPKQLATASKDERASWTGTIGNWKVIASATYTARAAYTYISTHFMLFLQREASNYTLSTSDLVDLYSTFVGPAEVLELAVELRKTLRAWIQEQIDANPFLAVPNGWSRTPQEVEDPPPPVDEYDLPAMAGEEAPPDAPDAVPLDEPPF